MKLQADRTVLLIIDMQKDFFAPGGSADLRGKSVTQMASLPPLINEFAAELRTSGARIVFTQFAYDPQSSPPNYVELINASKKGIGLCASGSPGGELYEMDVHENDVVMEKLCHDSFAGTALKQLLEDWGCENVVLTGIRTDICIMATACRSSAEGYRTFVVSDLVGIPDDKKAAGEAILKALSYTAFVMPSAEIRQALE